MTWAILPSVLFVLGTVLAFRKNKDDKLCGELLMIGGICIFSFYGICAFLG